MPRLLVPPSPELGLRAIEQGDAGAYQDWLTASVQALITQTGTMNSSRMSSEERNFQRLLGEQLPTIVRHRAQFALDAWANYPKKDWRHPEVFELARALVVEAHEQDGQWKNVLLGLVSSEDRQKALDLTFQELFKQADDPAAVQTLLNWGANPVVGSPNTPPLYLAVKDRRERSLKVLLPVANPWKLGGQALWEAIGKQYLTMVDVLLPGSDPNALAEGLSHAAQTNNVSLLMKVHQACQAYPAMPLSDSLQQAFERAANWNAMNTLRYLLPHADPNADAGKALRAAMDGAAPLAMVFLADKTDLVQVQRKLVSNKEIEKLVQLMPLAPPELARSWAENYGKKYPTLLAAHRALQGQQHPPEAPGRRRRLRS